MEIKEFVTEVIVQIRDGIKDAEEKTGSNILPTDNYEDGRVITTRNCGDYSPVANLVFELSIVDNKKDGKSGGIGVFLGNVGIGAKGNEETEQTSLSKIKFNIPILLTS